MLRDGAAGGCVTILRVIDPAILQEFGVTDLHVGRLVTNRQSGFPSLPEFANLIWIRPFAPEDYAPKVSPAQYGNESQKTLYAYTLAFRAVGWTCLEAASKFAFGYQPKLQEGKSHQSSGHSRNGSSLPIPRRPERAHQAPHSNGF